MYINWNFENVDQALPTILKNLLATGDENGSRNGLVKEFTHVGITLHNPWQREILNPVRKANLAAQIAETMWVLSGRNDIEWLSHYLPRAADYSDDGETWRGGYGTRLRRWPHSTQDVPIDQIAHVVSLLRSDPLTRRAVATIYDPDVDTEAGLDVPCNNWLTFSNRKGQLDLHVGIRSNDVMWGWSGINAFEWSALLEIVAGLVGVKTGSLHFSTTSLHLYAPHWNKAGRIVDAGIPFSVLADSPRFDPAAPVGGIADMDDMDNLFDQWFDLEEEIRKGDPNRTRVEQFPEPMLQSWLRVLQWWWTGEQRFLDPLTGTRLSQAAHVAMQPPARQEHPASTVDPDLPDDFVRYVQALHNEKHVAYGDSWKRRGEMLGILANIARKVDRLGGGTTQDETTADTAIDLLVYLVKYATWMLDQRVGMRCSEDTEVPNKVIEILWGNHHEATLRAGWLPYINEKFDEIEKSAMANTMDRTQHIVEELMPTVFLLARALWLEEQDPTKQVDPDYRGADAD